MKTTKSILYFVLGTFVLFMTSCEPKKLKEEDVLLSNAQVEDIIKDGQLYNINEFLVKFMDPGKGNFASDSTHYRKRANDSKYPDIWLFSIDTLHIIGGGSLNEYLDQFTANSTGVEVLAGPQEGTAIGNIMLQAKACGAVTDIWEMRRIIANSISLKRFLPQDTDIWQEAYQKFLEITK